MAYYDGTKLLSMQDLSGSKPEVYISEGIRSLGKTTYFNRLLLKKFVQNGEKFGVIYRYMRDMADCGPQFFKEIVKLFFDGAEFDAKPQMKGAYYNMIFEGRHCGYALSVNRSNKLKKLSHVFADVERMVFDEFQSEDNDYCPDEVRQFHGLHMTVARGGGKQIRHVPVYMISNGVSLLNPYYITMGISTKVQSNTKYLRGDGFVLERSFDSALSEEQMLSGFNKAFKDSGYMSVVKENKYIQNDQSFIASPTGSNQYVCTLVYNREFYSIRIYHDHGYVYCDRTYDGSYPVKFSCTVDDHDVGCKLLSGNPTIIAMLRKYFTSGHFRFRDVKCRDAIITTLSY